MKKYVSDFVRRGLLSCWLGPVVLAVLYLLMYHFGHVQTLTVHQVCIGILSLTALAFLAGGVNVLYQVERLPLMVSIFIHGSVLYAAYLVAYLLNGWLQQGFIPFLVFSGIFVVGYLVIWSIIYAIIKHNTTKINALLKKKQQDAHTEL